jgi:hypothetical protein
MTATKDRFSICNVLRHPSPSPDSISEALSKRERAESGEYRSSPGFERHVLSAAYF